MPRPQRCQGNFRTGSLPGLNAILPAFSALTSHIGPQRQQLDHSNSSTANWTSVITDLYTFMGPFVARLVAMAAPMLTVTLQWNTIFREGNVGQLSIGSFPLVSRTSLTLVPIRSYSSEEGGLAGPTGPESRRSTTAGHYSCPASPVTPVDNLRC
ncbi:uncharacterized protein BT62DRAFT_1079909 [Guyanagaster necrorhizus]|uniref:Uncharacterized protein n=1 Tax=Guyanagaster necrorhizus TaxID=856835 RepID=A0A9P8ANH5_9AGAR|nr:uncharacterized protein BT62DRAFT_1079909 [Guyanagaster necrorhizus MCA 3950]KAG7441756.1 hypothetical protein BT62DRAFT_1079909 [Guyanagaster necrorhizus MCA 3950]